MANKKIKLSMLSPALRKEVKKVMNEGKVKLSQLPLELKKKVLKEWNEDDGIDDHGLSGFHQDDIDMQRFSHEDKLFNLKIKEVERLLQSGNNAAAAELCPHSGGYRLKGTAAIGDPRHGEEGFRCGTCKAVVTDIGGSVIHLQERKIKLSSLSDGLQKEVKLQVNEGKTKLSQMPHEIKKKVIDEVRLIELDFSMNPDHDENVSATEGDVFRSQQIERLIRRIDPTAKVEIITNKASGKPYYDWTGPSPKSWMTAIIRGNRDTFNNPEAQSQFDSIVHLFGTRSFVLTFWEMDKGETLIPDDAVESADFIGTFQLKNDVETSKTVPSPHGERGEIEISTYHDPRRIGRKEMNALSEGSKKLTIKLSSLSEGLRQETKKHLKEGKVKLSQFPANMRKKVVNEIFGFSKAEKADKMLKSDIQQAEKEIDNFNFGILFAQPANSSLSKRRDIMSSRMKMMEERMPTVKKLMPHLFDNVLVLNVMARVNGDNFVKGVMPGSFSFLVNSDGVLKNEYASKSMKLAIRSRYQLEAGTNEDVLNETGEWDKSDEYLMAWQQDLEAMLKNIEEDTGGKLKFESSHGFDAYQGPYAWVTIKGKRYKVWTHGDALWIDGYPVDNTSGDGRLPGYEGMPEDIADMINGQQDIMQGQFSLNEVGPGDGHYIDQQFGPLLADEDEYGYHMQVRSTNSKTNFMSLNKSQLLKVMEALKGG